MPRRCVPFLLLALVALVGTWAGTGFGALPAPPTVSLPTVTLPLPPVPPVTVPPQVPALPEAPKPAVPATPVPEPDPEPVGSLPSVGGSDSVVLTPGSRPSSRPFTSRHTRTRTRVRQPRRLAQRPTIEGPTHVRSHATGGVTRGSASAPRPAPEDGGFSLPVASAVRTLSEAAQAVPPALFAMVILAVALLAVASVPQPLRTSRAGAMLVHRRGSIAAAGLAALAMAVATYLLL